jgi:HEAT repeat protein
MGRGETHASFLLRVGYSYGTQGRHFVRGEMRAAFRTFLGVIALALGGCCDNEALPKMKRDLYSQTASERNEAALGLARCGAKAKDVVPRLSSMLYDSNVGVQSSAAYALREIDTPDARRALEQAQAAREMRRRRR